MKIVYKSGLSMNQIIFRNENIAEDIEIHMVSNEPNLNNVKLFKNKINTIHLPTEQCKLSYVLEELSKGNELLLETFKICNELCAAVIIHCDMTLKNFLENENKDNFIKFIGNSRFKWRIENLTTEEGLTPKESIVSPAEICQYINKTLRQEICFPLLDICHYLIVREHFDTDLDLNLKDTIELYNSSDLYIHLNDKLGTGYNYNGGIHGFNFKYNSALLRSILFDKNIRNATLCLEVYEKDFTNCLNAIELENKIRSLTRNI